MTEEGICCCCGGHAIEGCDVLWRRCERSGVRKYQRKGSLLLLVVFVAVPEKRGDNYSYLAEEGRKDALVGISGAVSAVFGTG